MNSISNVNIMENLQNVTCERVQGKHVGHHEILTLEINSNFTEIVIYLYETYF